MREIGDRGSSVTDIVAVTNLSRTFGANRALNDVSLTVTRGTVLGLVGENGAGKSTLIKHLLGLWRAETGTVRVFGLDPVAAPVAVLARVGYLSEQPDLPGWMRVEELLRYTQAFYPGWDPKYAEQLRDQFDLDLHARIKTLSKGQRAKLGLIAAQAHRPDLLLLDEPAEHRRRRVRRSSTQHASVIKHNIHYAHSGWRGRSQTPSGDISTAHCRSCGLEAWRLSSLPATYPQMLRRDPLHRKLTYRAN